MNHVFKDYLRHFVVLFFDEILIYGKYLQDHLQHELQLLKSNQLFAKQSKCIFGVKEVEYLGQYIWPRSKNRSKECGSNEILAAANNSESLDGNCRLDRLLLQIH